MPKPGCVKPIEFAGLPLLLVRNQDNEIKVFENVCRHRAMFLASESRKLRGPITCPYHSWAYDLNGQLRETPHIGGPDVHYHDTVNHCDYSLIEVRSYQWRDIFIEAVFVVEGMKKGRHSSKYDGGKFSAVMDAPTHHFHKWVAKALSEQIKRCQLVVSA